MKRCTKPNRFYLVPSLPGTIIFTCMYLVQEMNILSSSMQSLKTVQMKLKDSKESLDSINEKNEGKTT